MSIAYRKLLSRPEWKAKRIECLDNAGHRCERCGNDRNLQVHHPHYEKNRMPWEYDNLVVLCASCHQAEHTVKHGPATIGGRTVLEKKYFHSFCDEGYVKLQGQVLGHSQDGYYLIQLFSWMSGDPSNCELVHFSSMAGWMFYCTAEEMIFSMDHGPAKRLMRKDEESP